MTNHMHNMADIREKFSTLCDEAGVPSDYFGELMADFDYIVGVGTEIFEVQGWRDARYVLFHRDDDRWDWVFEDPIEGHEYGGVFDSRRDAMYAMAKDSDETMMVDKNMGLRIRNAI